MNDPQPGGSPVVPTSSIDTASVDPEHRHALWRQHIEPVFEVGEGKHVDESRFRADMDVTLVDDLILARCRTQAQRFERSPRKVLRDAHDHYIVQIFLSGETRAMAGGKEWTARPGDVWIIDMAAELDAVNTDFHNLSVVVPRAQIESDVVGPNAQHLRRIAADQPIARVFGDHLKSLQACKGSLTRADAEQLGPVTRQLTVGLLNSQDDERMPDMAPATMAQTTLFAAKRLIDAHLADPEFMPETLAAMLGVSRTALYRLFAPLGGVAAYIRGRRLRGSVRQLLDPAWAHRRIYEVAYAHGFRSETDYSRAFKRHFSMTPTEARAMRLETAAVDGPFQSVSETDLERWLLNLSQ